MAKSRTFGGLITVALIVVLIGFISWYFWQSSQPTPPQYYTATVDRGDLTESVTATGVLKPFLDVIVSSQISGLVNGIYTDFNKKVKKGQLLATLLPINYQAALRSAKANLDNAKANNALQEITLKRYKDLLAKNLISQNSYDTQEALVKQSRAQVEITTGAVDTATANLSYCHILSPIDGVVINRVIDIGNSVAASLSSPELFEIANDLTKMQIAASVAEADIGYVKEGQDVTFLVDTYPNAQFHGKVYLVRNSAITIQNVVTYDVMILVNNDELKLKPGMTANVSIIVEKRSNVVRIPNASLRFRMPDNLQYLVTKASAPVNSPQALNDTIKKQTSAERRKAFKQLMQDAGYDRSSGSPSPQVREKLIKLAKDRGIELPEGMIGGGGRKSSSTAEVPVYRTIYRLPNGDLTAHPEAIVVKLGISDGAQTEIAEGINPGDILITGAIQAVGTTTSPFGGRGVPGIGR
jgi:HlyD family secretion protein